jgi:hypothetical protein
MDAVGVFITSRDGTIRLLIMCAAQYYENGYMVKSMKQARTLERSLRAIDHLYQIWFRDNLKRRDCAHEGTLRVVLQTLLKP